jgi:peptidoglycan/xylan/chitin deacetylase (PgdA/CDA1 family)
MSVLALMYHRTPRSEVTSDLDVTLPVLREQVRRLQDAGLEFIPFHSALAAERYRAKTYLTLTLDDGHVSNIQAVEMLEAAGVPATVFVIGAFSREGRPGYMSAADISSLAEACDFGGHGETHVDLTALEKGALLGELSRPKAFLEDLLRRPVTTMSAPGGRFNQTVVAAARGLGYEVIGSSVELLNQTPSLPLARICVRTSHSPNDLLRLASANSIYWTGRRIRRAASRLARGALSRVTGGLAN